MGLDYSDKKSEVYMLKASFVISYIFITSGFCQEGNAASVFYEAL